MAQAPTHFIWVHELFGKALIKRAATQSAASVMASAAMQRDHDAYVIRVLEAPANIREQVKAALMEDHTAEWKKQLLCILTAFETFSPTKKAAFIDAYRGTATLAGQGTIAVIRGTGWDPLHIPPRLEP